MKLGWLPAIALSIAASVTSAAAATVTYSFTSNGLTQIVNPLSTAQTGAQFYAYADSETGAPLPLSAKGLQFYLHENSNTGDVSLGIIANANNGGGSGSLAATLRGDVGGTTALVRDDTVAPDSSEFVSTPMWVLYREWTTGKTDGFVLGNLTGDNWSIDFNVLAMSGILTNKLFFFSDEGGSTPAAFSFADPTSNTLTISKVTAAVPLPASAPLLLLAGGGLVALRRRRRKA